MQSKKRGCPRVKLDSFVCRNALRIRQPAHPQLKKALAWTQDMRFLPSVSFRPDIEASVRYHRFHHEQSGYVIGGLGVNV